MNAMMSWFARSGPNFAVIVAPRPTLFHLPEPGHSGILCFFFLLIFLEGSSSRVHGSRVRHFKKKFPNSKESKHSFETFLSSFVRSLSLSGSNNNNDNIRHHFWGSSLAVVPKSRSKTFWFRFLRSAAVQIRNVDFTTEIALGHPDVCCH